jgi:hypothetical protein
MMLPTPCALVRVHHAEIINWRCHVGYKYWLKFRLHVITDERISHKCAPFFDLLLCPLVWKGRYSVSVMQSVSVDIHQMSCFFVSFIFLSLPPTSSSSLSISSLCFSSPHSYFTLHAVTLFCTPSHPQFSCIRFSSVSLVTIIRTEWAGNRSSISCRSRDISVHRNQIIFGSHPACCPIDSALFFPGHETAGVEVSHSPASSAKMEHR